jgi:hypothetical protein
MMHASEQTIFRTVACLAATAAILAISSSYGHVWAAESKQKSVPDIVPPPVSPDFSDARLKAFAAASAKVMDIRQEYWPQVQAASSEEEMRRLTKIAQKKMLETVAAHGLTMDQYNEIVAAAKDDPDLIERIKKLEKNN